MSSDSYDEESVGVSPATTDSSDSSFDDVAGDTGASDGDLPAFVVAEDDDDDGDDDDGLSAPALPAMPPVVVPDVDPLVWNTPFRDPGPLHACPTRFRRRELLKLRDDGACAGIVTELDAFLGFFTTPVLDALCAVTTERLLKDSRPALGRPELFVWLGILFSMGINRLPSTKHYWATGEFGMCDAC